MSREGISASTHKKYVFKANVCHAVSHFRPTTASHFPARFMNDCQMALRSCISKHNTRQSHIIRGLPIEDATRNSARSITCSPVVLINTPGLLHSGQPRSIPVTPTSFRLSYSRPITAPRIFIIFHSLARPPPNGCFNWRHVPFVACRSIFSSPFLLLLLFLVFFFFEKILATRRNVWTSALESFERRKLKEKIRRERWYDRINLSGAQSLVDSIRGQWHGRVHTWQNLPPQIGNVYVLRYSVDDQTKVEGRDTCIYIYITLTWTSTRCWSTSCSARRTRQGRRSEPWLLKQKNGLG